MQDMRLSAQRARPRQKSCTECRRRRQKCNPRKDGPCGHCARRYPPVECIMPGRAENSLRKPKLEAEINLSETHGTSRSNSKLKLPGINERPYVSPYPILSESQSSSQSSRLKSILKFETRTPSSRSSSVAEFVPDRDGYFDATPPSKTEQSENISPGSDSSVAVVERGFGGSPRPFGGVLTAISSLNSPPIKSTERNAELFHLFHQFVIPNLVSVDGRGPVPVLFVEHMLPWMIQSPLMPNIAILMASYTQAFEQGLEVQKYSETLSIKSHVLSLINEFLRQDFDLVGGEALRAVIHLVILEWFWGAHISLWAHMKGLKQMVKLRGGFAGMRDPLLVQVLILTDYELACCFERDLYLQPQPSADEDLRIPLSYPERFSSPLLPFEMTFQQSAGSLDLSLGAAEILDDVQALTLLITPYPLTKTPTAKIQSTASWANKQLQLSPSISTPATDSESIFETIRLAALVYSTCIMSLIPFYSPQHEPLLHELNDNLSRVSLTRWKEIPGIFLWILLIAAPSSGNDAHGRFLKKKMAVAGMSIGLEDFNLATGHLRAFWKVQRWIARESRRVEEVKL